MSHQSPVIYRTYLILLFIPILILYYFIFQNLHSCSSLGCTSPITIDLHLTLNSVNTVSEFTNINCSTRQDFKSKFILHGKFWILYDFVRANHKFQCDESITYAAPADLNFLGNVIPLVSRWQGPVSISLYAPGTDYNVTMFRVRYLRDCTTPLIKKFVTFHVFFESKHFPKDFTKPDLKTPVNCNLAEPFREISPTYRKLNGLEYPLGLARNIARDRSKTHFFLSSDVEQYPNPGFIKDFFEFLKREQSRGNTSRRVYVLPHFEIDANVSLKQLPRNKSELQDLLRKNLAISFHDNICDFCHRAPSIEEWMNATVTPGLKVFKIGKRESYFRSWEPFFVGTSAEPSFDERFTWESNKDKRIQGYIMCLLKYEYHILDNAFLIHKPGIKTEQKKPKEPIKSQNKRLELSIKPQLNKLYGKRQACYV